MAQIGSRRQHRRRRRVKWLSHYSSAQTILVVGDGDLSFSLALAAAFGSGHNLVATSLDSYDDLTSKYGKAESNITELERLGATVLHGVDAKTMKRHPCLKTRRFDRIVFNFPHAGFIGCEKQDYMINAHQLLVRRFFRNASHLLCPDGEIHVSHKTGQPYDRWEIKELAYEFSLVVFEMVAFRKEDYPGYNQKRGDGERCDEEFSLRNGFTFKFCVKYEEAEECAQKGYSTHNMANQSSEASPSMVVKHVWRAKSPSAEISESNKQEEKNTSADTIKIGTKELEIKELGEGPIVVGNPVNYNGGIATVQQGPMANDLHASMSRSKPRDPKYIQPKWCPPGLSKTKKRGLQRMRNQEKVEQEAEKQMDESFNEIVPVVPSKQLWRPKQIENAAASTSIIAAPISSRENNAGTITSPMTYTALPSLEETPKPGTTLGDDDEMVDFEPRPVREGMDINIVYYLPAQFRAIDEKGEVAQLDFDPKNAIFEKPKELVKHLKPLYVKGHVNGLHDDELIKANMVLNGFEGKEKTEAKGVMYLEHTDRFLISLANNVVPKTKYMFALEEQGFVVSEESSLSSEK